VLLRVRIIRFLMPVVQLRGHEIAMIVLEMLLSYFFFHTETATPGDQL
jgi:hypothetical protein